MAFKLDKASNYSLTAEAEIDHTIYQSPPMVIKVREEKRRDKVKRRNS
nr:hypothetical protein P5627_19695 [Bacillus safensis]